MANNWKTLAGDGPRWPYWRALLLWVVKKRRQAYQLTLWGDHGD